MAERDIDEQVKHDHIIYILIKRCYHYPNPAHPHLITFANHPVKTKAVRDEMGKELFPDIVVLNGESGKLVTVVEVETETTVEQDEAQEWQRFSALGARFYLYVPRGLGAKADMLCRNLTISEIVQYYYDGKHYVLERFR